MVQLILSLVFRVFVRGDGHHPFIGAFIIAIIVQVLLFKQMNDTSFSTEGIAVDTDTDKFLAKDQLFGNKLLTFTSQSTRNYEN